MLSLASPIDDIKAPFGSICSKLLLDQCPTCCTSCSRERKETHFVQSSTFISLDYLLAAGSLALSLIPGESICSHQHAEDGFHALYNIHFLRPRVAAQDVPTLNALSFLVQNRFVQITYMVIHSSSRIVLRLYLVPYDLPGSKGLLHMRDEDKVMKPARSHLRTILPRPYSNESFLPADKDRRSLSQIFNDLTTTHNGDGLPEIAHLRTSLYEYQNETVTAMLAMEKANRITADPLYIPITGMTDRQFYFQPTTMELLVQRPQSYQARGGLLCEELGTGKTVMTLALILATLDDLPDPPEEDGGEILTLIALRHFPQRRYGELRTFLDGDRHRHRLVAGERRPSFPSLVELLCDFTRKHPSSTNLRSAEDIPLWHCIRRNAPLFFHFYADHEQASLARQKRSRLPRLMYLTTATLVVVPAALQAQWYSEILKHCSTSVRTLVVKSRKDLPPVVSLASDYDIVLTNFNGQSLIADGRLQVEIESVRIVISMEAASSKDLSVLDAGYTCLCPEFRNIRIPDCSCEAPGTVSPLLQIRWKRLVRDEGHNAASRSTELNHFLRIISAERRWIVTGTPTTNLLGLNFGSFTDVESQADEIVFDGSVPQEPDLDVQIRKMQKLDSSRVASEDDSEGSEDMASSRSWSRADRGDLRKLGSMLSDFLGVLPFAANSESFSNLVVNGLMPESGPLPGALRVLEQVMSANLVRHRVKDIERYVRLPPLNEELVLLDLEEYGQMTYNVLLSFVAVNAVDSERRDMDYLFHPSKTAVLASTIENLSHSLFWRSDENAFDYELPENIHRSENAIKHALERGQPDEDIQLVHKAIHHLRKALESRQYRDIQHGLEVPYRIYNASQRLRQTWGLVHEPEYSLDNSVPFLVYPSYALELRDTILRQPLIKEDSLATRAEILREKNRALTAFVEATKSKAERRSDSKSSSEKRKRREEVQVDRAKLDTARRTATTHSKEKLQELQKEFRMAQERLKTEAAKADLGDTEPDTSSGSIPSHEQNLVDFSIASSQLLRGSPYAQLRVGNSASSKLNYILEEVRKYSETEKFLIFSSQPFNLVHLSEGLDLMGVKYLHFMNDTSSTKGKDMQRDQWLTTFETSETYRVFLMELKYGARGLNIVSASRVIFCEPVWRADVESQAIKRVHRIGQTRPVTVKTLAIRGTFEEYMIQRRRDLKSTGGKPPGLAEEWGVRNYLQNPVFLETPPQNMVNLDFPLLPVPASGGPISEDELKRVDAVLVEQPDFAPMGHASVGVGRLGVRMDVDSFEWPSSKRRKVHFN
ncbi:hypothetical protein ACEPAG_5517 [Sanghuangporus baumii]